MGQMKVFLHQLYEYRKGVRPIALCTLPEQCREFVCKKLDNDGVAYIIRCVSSEKINLFFGDKSCLEVLKLFGDKPLNQFSAEEDFILGTMLGYSINEQCRRYCSKLQRITA